MAKLKTDPIGPPDLIEFLDTYSDFAFEIAVIKVLCSCGFQVEHGGTYIDPATKKPRQFDIRATRKWDNHVLRLAVECKNLQPHFPLLVSCLPRTAEESFHDIAVSVNPDKLSLLPNLSKTDYYYRAMEPYAKTVRLRGNDSVYRPNDDTGKSSDQIGRDTNNCIVANDSDTYNKWSQALASAEDLTDRACYDGVHGSKPAYLSFLLPVLAIPDGTLWQTNFSHDGDRVLDPHPVERVPFFVDRSYRAGDIMQGTHYRISHLEFVTLSGLSSLISRLTTDLSVLFPGELIIKRINDFLASGKETDGAI